MIESILEAQETFDGYDVRNLTSYSTGAQISLPFIRETWMLDVLNVRPVNSGVRHASHNEDSRGSCSETQKANAAVNGTISGGLTTHSTGAELAWISSSTWMLFADIFRPVNSGVRFLLNDLAQILNRQSRIFIRRGEC
jgi:hypothetical protein